LLQVNAGGISIEYDVEDAITGIVVVVVVAAVTIPDPSVTTK